MRALKQFSSNCILGTLWHTCLIGCWRIWYDGCHLGDAVGCTYWGHGHCIVEGLLATVGSMEVVYVAGAKLVSAIFWNKCFSYFAPATGRKADIYWLNSPSSIVVSCSSIVMYIFLQTPWLGQCHATCHGVIVASIVMVTCIKNLTKMAVKLTSRQSISRRCAAFVAHNAWGTTDVIQQSCNARFIFRTCCRSR